MLLALDLGTTSTRALVLEPGGDIRGRAVRAIDTHFPAPGRVEQDPQQLFERTLEAAGEALSVAGCIATDVAALGLVTQRSTAIAWDARTGRPLAPAIGWQDQRTRERVAELVAAGIPITTLPSATKFEWLLANVPEVANAAREGRLRFGTPDAWLGERLAGDAGFVTDPGQASCTGLFDLTTGCWNGAALDLFGVPAATLPEVVETSRVVAATPASLFGAPIPMAARAGDQQAACFAHGTLEAGDAKLTLGTAAMLDVNSGNRALPAPRGAYQLVLWRLREEADTFCTEGAVVTAGAAVDWLVDLGLLRAPAELDTLATSVSGSDGVVFVPALQGLGTPHMDDAARGLLVGLTRGSTAAHVARAVVEGLAHRCVELYEAMAPEAELLHVDGGLARSDLLLQRIADLAGRGVARVFETEATAVGAAWLAAHGAGLLERAGDARAWLPTARRFEPRDDDEARRQARERFAEALRRSAASPQAIR